MKYIVMMKSIYRKKIDDMLYNNIKDYLSIDATLEVLNLDMSTFGYTEIQVGDLEYCQEIVISIQEIASEYEILVIPEEKIISTVTDDKSILPMRQFILQKIGNTRGYQRESTIKLLVEYFGYNKRSSEKICDQIKLEGSALIATLHKEHAELREQQVDKFIIEQNYFIKLIVRGV